MFLILQEKKFPVLLLSLLYRCWAQNPEDRPSAHEINNLTSVEEFPKIIDILGNYDSDILCIITILAAFSLLSKYFPGVANILQVHMLKNDVYLLVVETK